MAMNVQRPADSSQMEPLGSDALRVLSETLARALSVHDEDDAALAREIELAVHRCEAGAEPRGPCLRMAYRTLLSGVAVAGAGGQVPVSARLVNRLGGPLGPAEGEMALSAVLRCGYPRAVWIAQLSALYQQTGQDAQTDSVTEWIQAHRKDRPGDVSAEEALLAERRYSVMLTLGGQFGEALAQAVRWRNMAVSLGARLSELNAVSVIGGILLSVGDVDGALPLFQRLLSSPAAEWEGAQHAVYYNALLCHVLRKEYDSALLLAGQLQGILPPAVIHRGAGLPVLLGFVYAHAGSWQQASDLLREEPGWTDEGGSALAGNRAWLLARTRLCEGRARDAQALCQMALAKFAERGWSLSPLNGTQLYATLADACEALGETGDALKALRQSQSHCFNWIIDSVAMRLRTLLVEGQGGDEQTLNRRLEAMVALGREGPGGPGLDAAPPPHYVAYLAHEIRNPLNGLVMMTELLQQTRLNRRQSQYVSMASSSALALMRLCDDLLDLARMDAGRFDMREEAVDVAALVRSLVGHFELQLAGRPVVVLASIDAGLPPLLRSDERRLRQVLMNLLGNAAKFTEQGRVEVEVVWESPVPDSGDAGVLSVAVRDTGIGFPAEVKPRLFEEFFQAHDTAESNRAGGSGLGLALCRAIVQQMGGVIDASSTQGQGSRFWFTLPMARWQALCEATPA